MVRSKRPPGLGEADHKSSKKPFPGKTSHAEAFEATTDTNILFTAQCPVWPQGKPDGAKLDQEDLHTARDTPSVAGTEHLGIDFSVQPGGHWVKLESFKHVKFNDPVEIIYAVGDVVYVNLHFPTRPAPPDDASDDDKIAFAKENFYVGLIREIRAATQRQVHVRLFWLYWPEELPRGRRSYHGKRELVMSNHVDIIDARTIAAPADVGRWDEHEASDMTVSSELYWRQTYDLTKMATAPHDALSELRQWCICGEYENPDVDMFQCQKEGCGTWHHRACLVANIEQRAWEQLERGGPTHDVDKTDNHQRFPRQVAGQVGHMTRTELGKPAIKNEARVARASSGKKRTKLACDGEKPWSGILEGNIIEIQNEGVGVTHRATVRRLVAPKSKERQPGAPAPWAMEMLLVCLKCGHPLNESDKAASASK